LSKSQSQRCQVNSKRGSKGCLPGSVSSHEGPFQLLIGDKHHHIPGSQAEKGGHEPREDKTWVVGDTATSLLPLGPGIQFSLAALSQSRTQVN
jgi:hypothetical protein